MSTADYLTENQVIEGVENYLKRKGRTSQRRIINKSNAEKKEHGVDLLIKLENEKTHGNWYFVEAKGNTRC